MEKLNIAEILKDCSKGMELDCTMYEDIYFDYVDELNIIHCYIQYETYKSSVTFNLHGAYNSAIKSKCVIFPKGKTTWEGFQRPFKDGDVLFAKSAYNWIFIYKENEDKEDLYKYVGKVNHPNHSYIVYDGRPLCCTKDVSKIRFATEEEKQKLFDAIKANGYKWDAETKTLEKLEKEKFDITTLKPFESRVLVRSSMDGLWKPAVFGFRNGYNDNAFYIVGGSCWKQCIPYLNNEHLCGTTDDCVDYFKTWE